MVKNCFVFDSCVDFANKAFDNVYVMPLSVIENVNGKAVTYEDGIQITTNEIEKGMIEGKIYKTSQTPLGKALELFEELSKKYDNVYVLPIHTKLSGQINSLNLLAKEEFSNVFVIPQVGISLGSTWQMNKLLELDKNSANGLNLDEVKDIVNNFSSKFSGVLIVPDVSYLVAGGRISNFKAAMLKLLRIKAVTVVYDYDGLNFKKIHHSSIGLGKHIEKLFQNSINFNPKKSKIINFSFLTSVNSDLKFNIKEIEDDLTSYFSKYEVKIQHSHIPSVIVAHTGPNYIAVLIEIE